MAKNKVGYVDGFVLVVPRSKIEAYKKMATEGKKMWLKFGAIDYKECMGDDMNPHPGGSRMMGFKKMSKAKPSEIVWFSYIGYKSRAHRDQVNKKVMAEMMRKYKDHKDQAMPFDMKRMAYAGFKVLVSS